MTITYTASEGGRTVYTAARREMLVSASLLRRLKATSSIYVNGEAAFTNRVLLPGDILTLELSAAEPECGLIPEHGEIRVLWESDGLLAADKPVGMLVHPTHSRLTGALANYVAGYLPDGVCHAVNRLDRDTSGVVLFAKCSYWTDLAVRALELSGEKEYLALVYGRPEPENGYVDAPIKRLPAPDMLRVTAPDGQSAVTRYETVLSGNGASLLRLRLETGRTHQIRVHMLHIGCPVLGDGLYCTDDSKRLSESLGVKTQALHAHRLSFSEPFSGRLIDVTSKPPSIFEKIF